MAEKEQKEKKEPAVYVADTESVYLSDKDLEELGMEEQLKTECWLTGIMKAAGPKNITSEKYFAYNNMPEFISKLETLEDGSLIYFWNLKWDASFILSYLINEEGWTPCINLDDFIEHHTDYYEKETRKYVKEKQVNLHYDDYFPKYGSSWDMKWFPMSYSICVSEMNQWYSVTLRTKNLKTIKLLDATKLCPMPLRKAAGENGFNCVFKKLEMNYSGVNHREFGPVTKQELDYFANDLRATSEIVWRLLEEFNMKNGITIASCALHDLKERITPPVFDAYFPDLREYKIPVEGIDDCFTYCQKAYFGGWSFVNPRYKGQVFVTKQGYKLISNMLKPGFKVVDHVWCADVNSEYPWALHSVADEDVPMWGHHYYPIGEPTYHTGEPTQEELDNLCVFRRFRCHFDLKPERFPYIHIRNSNFYKANKCLESDRVMGKRTLPDGTSTAHEFVMCQKDFELFQFSYDIEDYEAYDYVTFKRAEGIFDDYIDYWMEQKIIGKKTHNAGLVTVAKLHLNAIYGRLATGLDSSSHYLIPDEEGVLRFKTHHARDKKPVAMAAAAYCTAYARDNVVRAADANYDYFTYSDTDSIHGFSINGHTVQGIKIDKYKLGCWDMEIDGDDENIGLASTFVKQKTYIEITLDKTKNKVHTIIKAAGMSDRAKDLITVGLSAAPSMKGAKQVEYDGDRYMIPKLYLSDFRPGLCIKRANNFVKQIKGGCILAREDASIN